MSTMPVAEINAIRARTNPIPPPAAEHLDTANPTGWDPGHYEPDVYCLGPGRVALSYGNVERILTIPEAARLVDRLCQKVAEASR